MPLYSFTCNDCKETFDLLAGMTRTDEKKVCKKCGSPRITRQISRFSQGKASDSGEGSFCTSTL